MTEKLKGFPFFLIFFIYALFIGYQYYTFNYAPDGEVEQHKIKDAALKNEIGDLKKKLAEGQKFLKSLELKKIEIQGEVKKLGEYQGALSEGLDVPSMIKLLFTEAKKTELKVDKIEPGKKNEKAFYLEQEFNLNVRGTYQSLVLFTQRVSQLQRILRIEAYNLKPAASTLSKSNLIAASLSVRAYQYTMSKEDEIGKKMK